MKTHNATTAKCQKMIPVIFFITIMGVCVTDLFAFSAKDMKLAGKKESGSASVRIEIAVAVSATLTSQCLANLELPPPSDLNLEDEIDTLQKMQEAHLKKLQDSLSQAPQNFVLRNLLANKLTVLGKFQEAASHFELLLAGKLSARNRSAVLINYGNLSFLQDSLTVAEVRYQRALAADSSHKEVYLNLGTLYSAVDDDEGAIASYQQIVDSTNVDEIEDMLGLAEKDGDMGKADSQTGTKKNVKGKARSNLRKAAGRKPTRSTGTKQALQTLGPDGAEEVADILYWAEVK